MNAAAGDTPRSLGVGGEAAVRPGSRSGPGLGGARRGAARSSAGRMLLGLGDQLRPVGGVSQAQQLLLQRLAAELPPRRAAVERGPALQAEQDARRLGRWSAAGRNRRCAFSSLANPTTRRNSSGRRSDWARPKVTGRPERRDTSPIQATSARVPARSSPSRSPRREALSKTPATVAPEHVGDGVQLVGGRPRARAPAGRRARCGAASATSRSRARRPPWPRRPARPSPRCPPRWPACRPCCAHPSRDGAPRSARPCHRR